MKYSQLFGKTIRDTPKDATLDSHVLLYRAGFIRESTAGRYYLLPLGLRVQHKIQQIIKEEMDAAGAQEIIVPTLHPKYLWEETNRTNSVGFELMSIRDRNDFEFVLGGTAEEMLVDLVRKFQMSYKDLPFHLYQFSMKFRDELRARGGLLRLREFMMKDGYSFHASEEDFNQEYEKMKQTYTKIFERSGLKVDVVEADNGYIGGDYSHEFQVRAEAGEDSLFYVPSEKRIFNKEIAPVKAPAFDQMNEKPLPMEEIKGEGIIGVEELAKYLKIPVEKTTKTILFETEKGEIIAAALRGDYDISEAKLKKIVGCLSLKLTSPEKIKELTGAKVGYAGILNLPSKVAVFMDDSMAARINFEMGANKTDMHNINVNFGADLPEPKQFHDFKMAKKGDVYSISGEEYEVFKGIEVGNIFQLGYHYSSKMKGASFKDSDDKEKPYYMGCYGIGLARIMAAVVETSHDERGIIWPDAVAPFKVHLIGLDLADDTTRNEAEKLYKLLLAEGIEVLFDDRQEVSPGAKFADADLIGVPYRVVVSKRNEGKLELKKRGSPDTSFISPEELLGALL